MYGPRRVRILQEAELREAFELGEESGEDLDSADLQMASPGNLGQE